jgi:anthranilate/para-aminobenzoate synthase component II
MSDLILGHVGRGTGRHSPFDQVYKGSVMVRPEDIRDGIPMDALVIWGGEDISPSIYGDKVSSYTSADEELSDRDRLEVMAVSEAMARGIPVIGVCRGAQLVCAMSGGRLIQHVNNHGRSHKITTFDGHNVVTSSVHHQMMYPFDVEHVMIGWSTERRSDVYIIGSDMNDEKMFGQVEPEIVWFPKTKCLAIQGHPEFHGDPETDPFVQYCMAKVRQFILGVDHDGISH